MSTPEWVLLRTKVGFLDDTDHVDVQSSPPVAELYRAGGLRSGTQLLGLQVMVVWVDNAGEVLSPDTGTDRGAFDMQLLKVLDLHDGDSPADTTVVVGDSVALTACTGYRIYQWDGMTGNEIWVRLTSITEPATGTPTSMQVWVCPLERG